MKVHFICTTVVAGIAAVFMACQKEKVETVNEPPAGETAKPDAQASKTLYLPASVWMVPDGNDYNNPNSKYNNTLKAEGPNIAIYWANTYGAQPANNTDPAKRFNPSTALTQLERFYRSYVDTLKFVQKGTSLTDQYKMLTYVFDGSNNTAYGSGAEKKIGVLWTNSTRINTEPYGVLAHELGHSFQYMVNADGAWGFTSRPSGSKGQTIFEMTSQYMLWQVYPSWMTFENYHFTAFMKQTHLAFLHEDNQYHSPYVLEYWSNKHGRDFIGRLWRSAIKGEDAVMAYKRMNGLEQAAFNDEMFDATRRFMTWDMARIEQVAKPYANKHYSKLSSLGNGKYRIAAANCPQNYGYNGIKLNVPAGGTNINMQFKGIAGASGYRAVQTDKAGWRYGFVAVKTDGSRTYGNTFSASEGNAQFSVPAGTAYLWLVVMGAPTAHFEHIYDEDANNDEQWPYEFTLQGTTPDNAMLQ